MDRITTAAYFTAHGSISTTRCCPTGLPTLPHSLRPGRTSFCKTTVRALPGRGDKVRQASLSEATKIPIWIELEALTTASVELFERSLLQHPEIKECYAVAGNPDYLLFVSVSEMQEFDRLHRNVLSRLPGVRKIRTEFLLRRILPLVES
ncbi:Lrp/AsnC ligand binding domain-containing protein [Mesorhizobium sp. NPDC059054]|uniref:Lrp/AsnC ligand binding domain-containing protein n=1 Tax=Mesorhizobium sp. NPDC059054 TaxID=3346711 RepID=UPI0036803E37